MTEGMMDLSKVANVLGGEHALPRKIESRMDLIELGDKGVTKDALLRLAKYRVVSEQILQIAEVAARGVEVFGDRDRFLSWIKQPNSGLGNRTPTTLLGSRFGTEMVLDELGRIEHGVVS